MPRRNEKMTAEELRKLIWYCPLTGRFLRLPSKGSRRRNKKAGYVGSINSDGYLLISIDKVQHYAHRLAWLYMTGEWPKNLVDHKDMNTSNNKWDNLREATVAQNARNRGPNKSNTTGYKGIHKNRDGYMVRICIGTYKTVEEAAQVYEAAIKIYHGEFARPSLKLVVNNK